MRIDPVIAGMWREALEDLDIDGYLVKKVPFTLPIESCLSNRVLRGRSGYELLLNYTIILLSI